MLDAGDAYFASPLKNICSFRLFYCISTWTRFGVWAENEIMHHKSNASTRYHVFTRSQLDEISDFH